MSLPTIFCLTDSLSQDFSKLLIQDIAEDFNVSISVGEFPNKRTFFAHSLILRARSPYFRKVLTSRKCGPNEDMITYTLANPNFSPTAFEFILGDNFVQWSSDDFLILELSLHNCLPWIRFFHMPYREFSIKVMPFEKILPNHLVHDVQLYHFVQNCRSLHNTVLPPRLGVCNSSIITWSHMGLIASWIDRKDCENALTTESFIFSIDVGKSDSMPTKRATTVSRVTDANKAIYSFVALGPYFGDGDLKVCIRYDSPSCSCTHKSYSSKILEKSDWMVVEEYEVFKVETKNENK
ncbi:16141_t:CDS:2 [Dentiscutata erythropus]|uniref:16141_t:CDS:1 n=1 Tax=Dentiscutata erythropus TaxID=1348616 RepID=A0A9N9ACG0_9GLOM|nr:16141_t:CDS:2 [Dentiscutata erythropus]